MPERVCRPTQLGHAYRYGAVIILTLNLSPSKANMFTFDQEYLVGMYFHLFTTL